MTTTYDTDPNPIENGVQQVYIDLRESLDLILSEYAKTATPDEMLVMLDDALSNNWDALMRSFWQGVKQDVELLYET